MNAFLPSSGCHIVYGTYVGIEEYPEIGFAAHSFISDQCVKAYQAPCPIRQPNKLKTTPIGVPRYNRRIVKIQMKRRREARDDRRSPVN
jgi:hypothetical protein